MLIIIPTNYKYKIKKEYNTIRQIYQLLFIKKSDQGFKINVFITTDP